jgi:phosphoglycolate phosphatase
MKRNKILLFDFDGTIVDSLFLVKKILNDLSSKYRYRTIENKDVEMLRGKGPKEILKLLKVPKAMIPFIAVDVKRIYQNDLTSVFLVKGIKETLDDLYKKGFGLGILTSNGEKNVKTFLKLHQIDFVDFVYADIHIFGKSRSIEKALEKNGIAKKNVIYIGDEIRDIDAAKKVGIKIIAVSWGFNNAMALRKASPDYVVKDPKELIDMVLRLEGIAKPIQDI